MALAWKAGWVHALTSSNLVSSAIAPIFIRNPAVSLVLFAAAAVQIGDSVLGLRHHDKGLTIGPMIAAILFIALGAFFAVHY